MQLANVPYKFQFNWSQNASGSFVTDPIPATTSSPSASQSLGFPPETSVPVAAGGTPPNISDYNGMFKYLSAWTQWLQAGSAVVYDATFQTNVGGYPRNAIICSAAYPGVLWLSLVDDNTSDPDTGGADWVQYPPHGQIEYFTSMTFTVPDGVTRIYAEVWGGGGGSSPINGSSGAGGGYTAGWLSVTPGQTIAGTVGAAGASNVTVGLATNGGTTTFSTLAATGGTAGNSGPGPGGVGSGGTTNLSGQGGVDLDGTNPNALGGDAPLGGFGGNVNAAGSQIVATAPGGGAGANSASGSPGIAAGGGIRLTW